MTPDGAGVAVDFDVAAGFGFNVRTGLLVGFDVGFKVGLRVFVGFGVSVSVMVACGVAVVVVGARVGVSVRSGEAEGSISCVSMTVADGIYAVDDSEAIEAS